ncbi:MAG: acyl carrier protein [Acidobacteriota bacterium]
MPEPAPTERLARQLIADTCGRPPADLQPEHELLGDLAIDSPKALRLLMDLEDQFGIEVADEDAASLRTVADVVAFVQEQAS